MKALSQAFSHSLPHMHTSETPETITIADVARRAGVSISTVSRVVNDSAPVDEPTAVRVREAVAMLGYVPQAAARNLAKRSTNTIGLLLPSIGEDFFSLMMRGIEKEATAAGYDLLIATQASIDSHQGSRFPFGRHNTDGMLIFTGNLEIREITPLYQSGFPIVLLYESAPKTLHIPTVTVENRDGTRKIIDHLIEVHNRRRIAFIRGPVGNEDSNWREMGYRASLAAHGIPYDPEIVVRGEYNTDTSIRAITSLIKNGQNLEAIFGGSDEGAIGAFLALNKLGIRIPEDIAVVGFDDLTLAQYLHPALTTVHAPTEEVGRVAFRQLHRLLHKEEVEDLTLLPTELIIRQSCGCP
jgi:LacI family transcriptional regulator, galactose operon repressor